MLDPDRQTQFIVKLNRLTKDGRLKWSESFQAVNMEAPNAEPDSRTYEACLEDLIVRIFRYRLVRFAERLVSDDGEDVLLSKPRPYSSTHYRLEVFTSAIDRFPDAEIEDHPALEHLFEVARFDAAGLASRIEHVLNL